MHAIRATLERNSPIVSIKKPQSFETSGTETSFETHKNC